ncbi:MAG: cyclic pyranopterin monophosphate synthase MoaC [Planctomycetota bacterium]|nr:cyclic pyranopterin monophosphate synthase MoaC [Planctomycetota bacterium]
MAPEQNENRLTHLATGEAGEAEARMVDVGQKPVTARAAVARAEVVFPAGLLARIEAGEAPKGSLGAICEVARVAGILAAKRTGELIPMCHPLGLDHVELGFERRGEDRLQITCRCACEGRTGIEMEAMTAASIAALTVYDMTKAMAKGIRVESVELLEKHGGKSGHWRSERA